MGEWEKEEDRIQTGNRMFKPDKQDAWHFVFNTIILKILLILSE
jgi:hypothetical protein